MASPHTPRVAIIGAGAAGLATARRMLEHGVACTLIDPAPQVGGGWSDPHSPIWPTLRTNLPTCVMQFHDYSFDDALSPSGPSQRAQGVVEPDNTTIHGHTVTHCAPDHSSPTPATPAATVTPATALSTTLSTSTTVHTPPIPPRLPSFPSPAVMADYLDAFYRTFLAPYQTDGLSGAHGNTDATVTTERGTVTTDGVHHCAKRPKGAAGNATHPSTPTAQPRLDLRLRCNVVSVQRLKGYTSDRPRWTVVWESVGGSESKDIHGDMSIDTTDSREPACATSTATATHVHADSTGHAATHGKTPHAHGEDNRATAHNTRGPTPSNGTLSSGSGTFDAVVVANGHYTSPFTPSVPGDDVWPGDIVHSSTYRAGDTAWSPGRRVVVVGAKASGTDIARELVAAGCVVHVADKARVNTVQHVVPPIVHHPPIRHLDASGSVVFEDGSVAEDMHVILYCTGYDYTFPFLNEDAEVTVVDRGVRPLYKQMFHTKHTTLAFIGLPWSIIPFPLFDAQARLAAAVVSGDVELPKHDDRVADTAEWESRLVKRRDMHKLAAHLQFAYCRQLASLGRFLTPSYDRRLKLVEAIYSRVGQHRPSVVGGADTYRDATYDIVDEVSYSVLDKGMSQREVICVGDKKALS
eukprot:m.195587 g.195587  ORF g.195587 m.195587 type:complete len:637 (+) comp19543_c0_seq1:2-1912(+)